MTNNLVTIVDVSPWEGFQNSETYTPFDKKIQYINMLTEAGVKKIVATSFAHPKVFPQFIDAEEIMRHFSKDDAVTYIAATPNEIGCRRALNAGAREVLFWVSTSETHNMRMLHSTVADTLKENQLICEICQEKRVKVRSVIATAFGCTHEGKIPMSRLMNIALRLDALGCYEICLADTHGLANPRLVRETISTMKKEIPLRKIGGHFHDLRGMSMANTFAAFEEGIEMFDAAVGGRGCAPDIQSKTIESQMSQLVYMFEEMGVSTGINIEKIYECEEFVENILGIKQSPSKLVSWKTP